MIEDLKEKINEAKEKLNEKNAHIISELMQIENYNENRHVGCCPNPTHDDSDPSFSYNPKSKSFYCFGCGYTVDIIDALMITKHCTFIEACEMLFELAGTSYDFSEMRSKERNYRYPKPEYADNNENVYKYLGSRGISKETVDYLDIRQDKNGNAMLQYYDLNNVLTMVKVRKCRPVPKGENKITAISGADTKHILYNINKINLTQPLIICSGEIDAVSAIEAGMTNATSIPFGDKALNWIEECWEFLQQIDEIILVPDNDDSGKKFAKEVVRRLGEYKVKIAEVPSNYEEQFIKDLNELLIICGKEAVRDVILNAHETEIDCIVDYSDIKKFDMSEVDGFKSGFRNLDKMIDKFFVGTVNLIAGSGGSGKSSFLSTIICQSIEQDFPCFVYSGELTNASLKSWVDFVHCGQRNINKYEEDGYEYYKVKPEAYNKINEFYKGKIFFYKDGFDYKASSLLKTIETVVKVKGVKTVVIDNLSVVDLENNDNNKWNKQDEFIRDLIELTKKLQIVTFIVLHPRKIDTLRRLTIFDLQGVTTATNLAHRIFSLYRCTDKDKEGVMKNGKWAVKPMPYDVILDCLKDRYGTGQNKHVTLYYDVPSKRFFTTEANLDYQYAWDSDNTYTTPLPYGAPQLEADNEVYGVLNN